MKYSFPAIVGKYLLDSYCNIYLFPNMLNVIITDNKLVLIISKTSLKMVRLTILSVFFILEVVQSTCPNLDYKILDLSHDHFPMLVIYRYKSVDPRILSPFHISEGDSRSTLLELINVTKQFQSSCAYLTSAEENAVLRYNIINMKPVDSNKFELNYEKDLLACNPIGQMKEIYVIDFGHKPDFISLYGCETFIINGTPTKFEGVLILADSLRITNRNLNEFNERLNITYKILQIQANISRDSLTTMKIQRFNYSHSSCNDIFENLKTCKHNVINELLKGLSGKKYFIIFCGAATIILVILRFSMSICHPNY